VSEDEKSHLYKAIAFWMLVSMGGSTALSTGVQKMSTDTRSDPFTGTQGRELEQRIRQIERTVDRQVARNTDMLGRINDVLDGVHEHIEEHNSEAEEWKRRIIANEYRLKRLERINAQ